MPIRVPNNLPAVKTLTEENVFVMTDTRAMTQDIRPLHILILNLMPTKIDTETQLTRLLGNTPLQVELELLQTTSHKATNTSRQHMLAFYKGFDEVKGNYYDGMIITGAPIELLEFEEVEYWEELCEIMEWSKTHVHSTFHICWGAQAGLYYHYGIKKRVLPDKLSGVYEHRLDYKNGMLFRGFDDIFFVPHSRNTTVYREDVEAVDELKIIASSEEAGIYAIKSENDRQIFIMGHSEYDWDTLLKEYMRDKNAGLNPKVPCNYFPNDDDTQEPLVRWRSCANLLYSNWLNYFVYQSTPFDLRRIQEETAAILEEEKAELKVAKFGGTSLCDGSHFLNAARVIKSDATRQFVVVSAPGKRFDGDMKVTDLLLRAQGKAENLTEILNEVKERYTEICSVLKSKVNLEDEIKKIERDFRQGAGTDYLASRGEYLNGKIMADYLGFDFIDARTCIIFDESGKLDEEATSRALKAELSAHPKAVVPGFYGNMGGKVKTFSRGGSDISGSLVAEAVGADIYENWTDVSGLLMADPKVVENPMVVPVITYKELRELSYMGAAVMHEDAVLPARRVGIPINIKNTEKPKETGTLIVKNTDYFGDAMEISGISGKKGYASIVVEREKLSENPQIRDALLTYFEKKSIRVKNILSGIDTLNVITRDEDVAESIDDLKRDIGKICNADSIEVNRGIALIAVVGRQLGNSPAVAVKVLGALADHKINIKIIDHGSNKINMLVGVDGEDYETSVRAIYTRFTGIRQ